MKGGVGEREWWGWKRPYIAFAQSLYLAIVCSICETEEKQDTQLLRQGIFILMIEFQSAVNYCKNILHGCLNWCLRTVDLRGNILRAGCNKLLKAFSGSLNIHTIIDPGIVKSNEFHVHFCLLVYVRPKR